jgi:hypothetical protein
MPNTNYSITGSGKAGSTSANAAVILSEAGDSTRSTSNIFISTVRRDSGTDAAFVNPDYVSIAIFG